MFLVQRISDGKFWINGVSWAQGEDKKWSTDPQKCLPFKSVAGAKRAFYGLYTKTSEQEMKEVLSKCSKIKQWRSFEYNGETYCLRDVDGLFRNVKFEERFKLVPIKFVLANGKPIA